ncbi:ScbR family autoregulator-binding transcription factor [Streptomyces sp. NPDC001194]|uniref:ScbR family autoregulator-binding transcription factor n=1 Tax=Streptomyces sp. NPDC001194 TaxID=3364547 RepID=UPI00368B07C1
MVKQERAARTREALIRAAAEVFDREGFSTASLTTISSLAGVSNGALHFHFPSKAALANAVEEAAFARLRVLTGDVPPAGASRVRLLVDVTHALAGALRTDPVLRAGFALSGEPSRLGPGDLREGWRCWVEETLKRAEAEGELRPEAEAADVVTAVVAATVGFEVLGVRDGAWLSAATVTRFWRLLLPTLVPAERLAGFVAVGTHSP